jgi:hypothetical protein
LFAPRARLWHKVSASFGGRRSPLYTYFDVRNRLLWAERHLPAGERARVWLWALGRACEPLTGVLDPLALLGRLRLRAAYWEARTWWDDVRGWQRPAARATRRATRQGLLDYMRRRFGDCPPAMRAPSV